MPQSEEPGYINGVIAAKTTKVGKIGIVGSTDGGDSARYVRGFIKGLQDTAPSVSYMLSWTGSFSDTVCAGDIGKTFIEADCDVLVGPAQQGIGALRNVDSSEGVLWVGQTTSQLTDFPNVVVAAADYDYSAVINIMTPLVLVGVGICVAYRSGIVNIGDNGQMIMGLLVAVIFALSTSLPRQFASPATLAMGMLGGAPWGSLPGILRALWRERAAFLAGRDGEPAQRRVQPELRGRDEHGRVRGHAVRS